MTFPSISTYKDALRIAGDSLRQLNHLRPVDGKNGDLYFSSGNFAVVFKMRDTRDGSLKALKCFTRDQERRRESLEWVSTYLDWVVSPHIIPYKYFKDELWAENYDHPVLLMDWVEGETLGAYVQKVCVGQEKKKLEELCERFVKMALWLLDQPWAHGDLKHDNIIVQPDGSLVLVDYDGCFVPGMEGQKARELGSPAFQHPKRGVNNFDRHIDDFSILVIFLSLQLLIADPDLFRKNTTGENLVLGNADIQNPAGSKLLNPFRQSRHPFLKSAVKLLDSAVAMPPGKVFALGGVLNEYGKGVEIGVPIQDPVGSKFLNPFWQSGRTFLKSAITLLDSTVVIRPRNAFEQRRVLNAYKKGVETGDTYSNESVVSSSIKDIYKTLKIENNIYLIMGILLIVAFIINITLIGICPYPNCIHQVYKENTSNLYIAAYYIALYFFPLLVAISSLLELFSLIIKRVITKNSEYNNLILRFFLYILSGFVIVVTFIFIFNKSISNGKFDFWMFPRDTGELLLIILIIICLILRKILTEWKIEKKWLLFTTAVLHEEMIFIPGGTFLMGDVIGDNEMDDKTVHEVTLSAFQIGAYAVTFDQYDTFCEATKRIKPADEGWGRGKRPVIHVSWEDTIAYCNWRSKYEGLEEVYTIRDNAVSANWQASGYRLPTEAEWEYAAREGGKKVRFGNGKDIANPKEINFNGSTDDKKPYSLTGKNRKKTLPVGSFAPNTLRLYDMSGNVCEWCWDRYGSYPSSAQTNPKGPDTSSLRVYRGGSWNSYPQYCRVAYRFFNTPGNSFSYLGFRLARTL